MENKVHTPVDEFEWLSLVVDPYEPRERLRFVYSDGKIATGTNGHVLFRSETDLDAGFYDAEFAMALDPQYPPSAMKFPDTTNIIPKAEVEVPLNLGEFEQANWTNPETGEVTSRVKVGEAWYNETYINQAFCPGNVVILAWGNEEPGKKQPLYGKNNYGHFCVMPIRTSY